MASYGSIRYGFGLRRSSLRISTPILLRTAAVSRLLRARHLDFGSLGLFPAFALWLFAKSQSNGVGGGKAKLN